MQTMEQLRKMSLPERTYKHVDTSRGPTLATMDQSHKGGESVRISPTNYFSPKTPKSPSSSPYMVERLKHHDPEEDQGLYQKKSVLFKMREGVKRLRNSFRLRKQEEEDRNLTPSWGVTLQEDEEVEEEEDAEYLGAPMYESELAPEGYKENARQHPRANPVISEKHVLHNPFKSNVEHDQQKTHIPAKSTTTTTQLSTAMATTTLHDHNKTEKNIAKKLQPTYLPGSNSDAMNSKSSKIQGPAPHHGPNMKMTGKNLPEKLTPACVAAGSNSDATNSKSSKMTEKKFVEKLKPTYPTGSNSDATNSIPSKIQDLAISRTNSTNMSSIAPSTPPIASAPISRQTSLSSTPSINGNNYTNNPKGASVKEYLKIKFEPMNNDEKVLSEVLHDAMSPRKTTIATNDAGVVDKVRGAMHSLLHNHNDEQHSQQYGVKNSTTRASSQTPAITSSNLQEVGQEENHGRILQAN